jgi:hypothetical protein
MKEMFTGKLFFRLSYVFCAAFFLAASGTAQEKGWRPIAPADLQAQSAVVEQGADAEAIFWEVKVDDSDARELALNHYVRIKIFTDKGRDDFARHDVAFAKGRKIRNLEARVTKPDGSESFVDKNDIHERDLVKANGFKVRAKSIAFPNLEVGSIIEYKYREVVDQGAADQMRLSFQTEIPIRHIAYYVKPFSGTRAMVAVPFNMGTAGFVKDKDGFHKAEMRNVPAFKEEPSMLPEDQVKSWYYIYYTGQYEKDPDNYWKQISKNVYDISKSSLKPNKEVETVTADLLQGAATDDEKLERIYNFTKTQIKNTTYAENVSDEEKKQAAKNKSAGDTLKYKLGTAGDIDQLFGAMARAAGYEARIALSGNRSDLFFDRTVPNLRLMLGSSSIAVQVGGQWRFFSPASYFVPYGMMSWIEEDQVALIGDSKELLFVKIPLSDAARSMQTRTGKFKLDSQGTLTGEARIEYTGHQAFRHKMLNRGDSRTEQENRLKELVRATMGSTAEVENITIENINDPEKPFAYGFKVTIPGYAQRTGRRVFFQPNVYERASQPRFTASSRKYDVYIPYPYSSKDEFTLELPAGFSLESPEVPGELADAQGIGKHKTSISVSSDGRTLNYIRNFSFGNGGFLRFPAASYQAVKGLFDAFHKADSHQLTLLTETASAGNAAN